MVKDVTAYLRAQQNKTALGSVAEKWQQMETLFTRKLWHQLTLLLLEFVKDPIFAKPALIELYENFVSDFEHRIAPKALAKLATLAAEQYSVEESEKAVAFIGRISDKVKSDPEALILCGVTEGVIQLQASNVSAAKTIVEEMEKELDKLDEVTDVYSKYYEFSSLFYKMTGDFAVYYRHSLRYLGCTDTSGLSENVLQERAFDLGLSALLGQDIYNFGELLAHPILDTLAKCPERKWLVEVLLAFNCGNLTKFAALATQWSTQPDLMGAKTLMKKKIQLMCLMEMVFRLPPTGRLLKFKEIASQIDCQPDEVEIIVMRALSLGLIKGSLDELEGAVHVTWLQPRVLDQSQLATTQSRLNVWLADITSMDGLVQEEASQIVASA